MVLLFLAPLRPGPQRARGLCLFATLTMLGGCNKPTEEPLSHPEAAGSNTQGAEAEAGDHQEPTSADELNREDSAVETVDVDGVKLKLVSDDCRLSVTFGDQTQDHHFDFPGACHFSPDREGHVWVVATDHGKALLVESWVSLDGGDCDTALQVVVVTEKGPELSAQIQRVSGCGPGPWDEMMYHVLAGDRVALGS